MKTALSTAYTKNGWKARKMRVAGVIITIYRRETDGGNFALQVRNGGEAVTIYQDSARLERPGNP
jgi:hypothetical protein